MVENIRGVFKGMLGNISWMDAKARTLAVKKVIIIKLPNLKYLNIANNIVYNKI